MQHATRFARFARQANLELEVVVSYQLCSRYIKEVEKWSAKNNFNVVHAKNAVNALEIANAPSIAFVEGSMSERKTKIVPGPVLVVYGITAPVTGPSATLIVAMIVGAIVLLTLVFW